MYSVYVVIYVVDIYRTPHLLFWRTMCDVLWGVPTERYVIL